MENSMSINIFKYPIIINGVTLSYINPFLIEKENLSQIQIEKLTYLEGQVLLLENSYDVIKTNSQSFFEEWINLKNQIQATLQQPINYNLHRFWDLKSCTCPCMENEDSYPEGPYIFSGACAIHQYLAHQ